MTDWKETRFSQEPSSNISIAPGLYLQVRNVQFVSDEEGWTGETREVTGSELKLLDKISELKDIVDKTNLAILNNL